LTLRNQGVYIDEFVAVAVGRDTDNIVRFSILRSNVLSSDGIKQLRAYGSSFISDAAVLTYA